MMQLRATPSKKYFLSFCAVFALTSISNSFAAQSKTCAEVFKKKVQGERLAAGLPLVGWFNGIVGAALGYYANFDRDANLLEAGTILFDKEAYVPAKVAMAEERVEKFRSLLLSHNRLFDLNKSMFIEVLAKLNKNGIANGKCNSSTVFDHPRDLGQKRSTYLYQFVGNEKAARHYLNHDKIYEEGSAAATSLRDGTPYVPTLPTSHFPTATASKTAPHENLKLAREILASNLLEPFFKGLASLNDDPAEAAEYYREVQSQFSSQQDALAVLLAKTVQLSDLQEILSRSNGMSSKVLLAGAIVPIQAAIEAVKIQKLVNGYSWDHIPADRQSQVRSAIESAGFKKAEPQQLKAGALSLNVDVSKMTQQEYEKLKAHYEIAYGLKLTELFSTAELEEFIAVRANGALDRFLFAWSEASRTLE